MTGLLSTAAVRGDVAPVRVVGPAGSDAQKPRSRAVYLGFRVCALGGIRTPNLLIRSQMLYPLSYERTPLTGTDAG
jgi:hypothetical protein